MPKAIDLRRRARAGAGASAIRYSKSIDYSHATAGVVVAATGGASLVGGGGVGGGALGRGASETDLLLDTSSASSTATSMTSREMREYRTLFDILDEDQSGAIGKDELKEAFSRVSLLINNSSQNAIFFRRAQFRSLFFFSTRHPLAIKSTLSESVFQVGTIASDEAIDALINEIDADGSGEIGASSDDSRRPADFWRVFRLQRVLRLPSPPQRFVLV